MNGLTMATDNQRDINLVAISTTPMTTMRRSNNFMCLLLSVTFLPLCSSRDTTVHIPRRNHSRVRGQASLAEKARRASLHSLRGSRTAHSWKSEGPYYLPNPSLRGTVDRKAPSKPLHSSKREGKGPMSLHDPCRFDPIYTRSQSPIGPATTPQNGSSCETFSFWLGGDSVGGSGSSQKRQKVKPVFIVAPAGAAISILVLGGLFYMRRQHGSMQGSRESTQENPDFRLYDSEKRIKMSMESSQFEEDDKKGMDVPLFDLEIILQATDNFSDENILGRGGFGPVSKVHKMVSSSTIYCS
ncbi:hypothetical protein NL676_017564 [Syzygium grande]|nr:hypothetical protein NL676_017564 [Syzygium grande]